MTTENQLHVLFEHDYLTEIMQRLSAKSHILNVSSISRQTGVPRVVIQNFISGQIPKTSFTNVVALYKFIEEQNI